MRKSLPRSSGFMALRIIALEPWAAAFRTGKKFPPRAPKVPVAVDLLLDVGLFEGQLGSEERHGRVGGLPGGVGVRVTAPLEATTSAVRA